MGADIAHEAAEAAVERFRLDAAKVYREAERTARANLTSYLETFAKKDEEMRRRVADGGMTEGAYQSWRRGQMLTGRRYRAVLDQVAAGYTDANERAMGMLRERLGEVAAENCDYATWQVEDAAKVDTTYALQDASTIDEMIRDAGTYLPKPSVRRAKDEAWNRRRVAAEVTQGVLLGESIPKIAARIRNVTNSTAAAATRAARTSVTAAECAGRVAGYHRAQDMGIELEQAWMATLDGRTRHSHRQMDGERVAVGEEFSNGCRYPGDPEAPYAETMNCRCTLVAVVDGIDQTRGERFSRLPEGMGYEEWRASKPARVGSVPANRTIAEFMAMPGTARKLEAAGVGKTEARRLLTEQLREYGIPSGSFRKMSAGDQQSVFDRALARVMDATGHGMDREAGVYSKLTKEQVDKVAKTLRGCDKRARKAYLAHEKEFRLLDAKYEGSLVAYFSTSDMGVRLNASRVFSSNGGRPSGTTWFHEFGHYIDYLHSGADGYSSKLSRGLSREDMQLSTSFNGGVFAKTIRREVNAYIDERNRVMRGDFKKAMGWRDIDWLEENGYVEHWKAEYVRNGTATFGAVTMGLKHTKRMAYKSVADEISAMTDAQKADLSDLFGGATLNKCLDGWRHERDYWKPKGAAEDYELVPLAHEGFAEFFSAYTANPESLEVLRRYLPESSKIFESMLDELVR